MEIFNFNKFRKSYDEKHKRVTHYLKVFMNLLSFVSQTYVLDGLKKYFSILITENSIYKFIEKNKIIEIFVKYICYNYLLLC